MAAGVLRPLIVKAATILRAIITVRVMGRRRGVCTFTVSSFFFLSKTSPRGPARYGFILRGVPCTFLVVG